MSQRSEQVLEELKSAYAAYYDVEGVHDGSALKALCSYHTRDSQYVLVKKAELWAAESHEYLYLWDAGRLDAAGVEEIFRRTLEDGEPRVKPHSQHMYTYLTAVVLYESAGPSALEQLKKLQQIEDAMEDREQSKTYFDRITASPETMAEVLASIPTLDAPWDELFQRTYCPTCQAENCDAENCPHQTERNSPMWFLMQEETEVGT